MSIGLVPWVYVCGGRSSAPYRRHLSRALGYQVVCVLFGFTCEPCGSLRGGEGQLVGPPSGLWEPVAGTRCCLHRASSAAASSPPPPCRAQPAARPRHTPAAGSQYSGPGSITATLKRCTLGEPQGRSGTHCDARFQKDNDRVEHLCARRTMLVVGRAGRGGGEREERRQKNPGVFVALCSQCSTVSSSDVLEDCRVI